MMSAELLLQSWGTYTEVKSAGFFYYMNFLDLLVNSSPKSAKS